MGLFSNILSFIVNLNKCLYRPRTSYHFRALWEHFEITGNWVLLTLSFHTSILPPVNPYHMLLGQHLWDEDLKATLWKTQQFESGSYFGQN